MNTIKDDETNDFEFDQPAIYQIIVKGELDPRMSSRLGGMQINVKKNQENKSITALVGSVADQSALSGILNSLNDLHLTVLSVKALK